MALTKIDDRGLKTPIDLLDNEKIRFGTGNDLQIYHESNEDKIFSTATKLEIRSPDLQLQNSGGEKYIVCTSDGSVELYHNHSKKLQTRSDGVGIASDSDALFIGAGDDVKLYHNSGNAILKSQTGTLYLASNSHIDLRTTSGSEKQAIFCNINGSVDLYHNGNKKLETTSGGVTVTGNLSCAVLGSTNTSGAGLSLADDVEIWLGNGDDLKIYHDGSDSYIKHNGQGNLYIQTSEASVEDLYLQAGNDVYIRPQTGENGIHVQGDGNVSLYYDGSIKCYSTANGFKLHTSAHLELGDSSEARFGNATGGDLTIYHDGSDSYIKDTGTGDLIIRGDDVKIQGANGNNLFVGIDGGGGSLWYNGAGSAAVAAVSGGADVTGKLNVESAGGSNYIAHFRNGTSATPYTVHIEEPNSPTAGYPLLNVTNNGGTTQWLRVDSDRGVTKLKMHSGAGIDFSATGNSSGTVTSELFDDYEYGSFSPTMASSGGSDTVAYSTNARNGFYIKQGRLVTVFIDVSTSSWSGGSGGQIIKDLPFAKNELSGVNYYYEGVSEWNVTNSMRNSKPTYVGYMANNSTQMNMYVGDAEAGTVAPINVSGRVAITFSYTTSS